MAARAPSLAALRAFDAAARTGSFLAAAEELRLTQSAVSHQIRGLEQDLGEVLFARRHRGVTLTPAGERLRAHTVPAFEHLRRGVEDVRAGAGAVLRISSASSFATAIVIPRLPEFERSQPGLDLRLEITERLVDFDAEPVDVGLRLSRAAPTGVHAERLMSLQVAPVCAPEIARDLHAQRDLAAFPRIVVGRGPTGWGQWLAAAGGSGGEASRRLVFDTLAGALDSAIHGAGVFLAPTALVSNHVATGRLARPFETEIPSGYAYWAICRRGAERSDRVAALLKWLRRLCAEATT